MLTAAQGGRKTYVMTVKAELLACRMCAVASPQKLQQPHGGTLQQLLLPEDQAQQEKASCSKSLELSDRNACDVELLCVGCAPSRSCTLTAVHTCCS